MLGAGPESVTLLPNPPIGCPKEGGVSEENEVRGVPGWWAGTLMAIPPLGGCCTGIEGEEELVALIVVLEEGGGGGEGDEDE